jgi:Tfp pilus assembly protein FimV
MYDFFNILNDIFSIFGYLIRTAGFLLVGLGLGRFFLANYPKSNWQLQMALALGFFGLIIALTVFSSAGSAGAFALGAGIAFLNVKKEEAPEMEATLAEEPKEKK